MSKTYFLLEVYNLCYEIILYMSYIEFKTKDQVSLIRRKAHNVEFIIDHSKKCKKCITKKITNRFHRTVHFLIMKIGGFFIG